MVTIFEGHIQDGMVVPDAPIDLPNGTSAEVRVILSPYSEGLAAAGTSSSEGLSMLELLETLPPPGLFKTANEVDRYLREERDSWDN